MITDYITTGKTELSMETEKAINDIRALISASEIDGAYQKTRQFFFEKQLEKELVALDMLESEWNDIQEQQIHGLLSVDDLMRFQNINKAKLMQLLLQVGGDGDLGANLTPQRIVLSTVSNVPRNQIANQAFKEGVKNFMGIALLIPAFGALISKDWAIATCFAFAGLVTFVPSLRLIEKTIRYELLSWQKYVLVIGALMVVGAIYTPKNSKLKENAPTERQH